MRSRPKIEVYTIPPTILHEWSESKEHGSLVCQSCGKVIFSLGRQTVKYTKPHVLEKIISGAVERHNTLCYRPGEQIEMF